jgi:Rod binding domain-containing protein
MKVSFTPQSDPIRHASGRAAQSPEIKAAREFEQIFVRKMLSSLEKTGRMGATNSFSGGNDVYSSMVVGALAQAVADSGGLGLADMIVRSIRAKDAEVSTSQPTTPSQQPVAPQPSGPQSVAPPYRRSVGHLKDSEP